MSTLSADDRRKLDALFYGLWGNRNGVRGSWAASSYRYHPTFIRRGGLLLNGETDFGSMWVLVPADATVTPRYGDSRASCETFPAVSGKAIRVDPTNDGPWWDVIHDEIPTMAAELAASYAERERRRLEQETARKADRAAELRMATEALQIAERKATL